MDDKELIKKVKNSLKAKKPRAEILQNFQKRGYKLAYAEELIKKAKRPKRITIALLISLVLFFSITFSAYTFFSTNHKMQISNPLLGITATGSAVTSSSQQTQQVQISYEEIKITPEYISFLLNEIGAWQLHKNPLTFQKPIINFKIDNDNFYSEIDGEIKTFSGSSKSADLQFNTNKQDIVNAIISTNPNQILKNSITQGRTTIELQSSEADLFAKGYLSLYDSLK